MQSSTVTRRLIVAATLAFGLAGFAGCASDSLHEQVKADPTPNLDTLHQRPEDIDNAMVVTFDENGRMFWQDLGRFWLTDRPSRLTREPIPVP
jgi:hypothetical protein